MPVLAGYAADAGSARLPPPLPPASKPATTPRRLRSRGPVREFTPKPSRFRLEAERKSMSPQDALDPIACRSVNPVVKQALRGGIVLICIAPAYVSARDPAPYCLGAQRHSLQVQWRLPACCRSMHQLPVQTRDVLWYGALTLQDALVLLLLPANPRREPCTVQTKDATTA